jgi:hypothetical protein
VKHGDADRESSDVIHTDQNGKFLGLNEIMANIDTIIQEHLVVRKHVHRIKNK